MRKGVFSIGLSLAFVLCLLASPLSAGELKKGGVFTVATIGEPPTLDPTPSTLDIVGMTSSHFFEGLFAYGKGFTIQPVLAESFPEITDEGRTYTIRIRKGVKFHNGKPMTSADVVPSIKRWLKFGVRGRMTAHLVDDVVAVDSHTVRFHLNTPFTPLITYLGASTGMAVIIPAEHCTEDGKLPDYTGTGPYKFVEHVPDRYIRVVRYDDYVPSPLPANGLGGERIAYADEIRFIPVASPNTRLEGALAGQYHFVDQLPIENYFRLKDSDKVNPSMIEPFGWPIIYLNCREGMMTNKKIRQAVQAALSEEDMMAVAFGEPEFYSVDGALYPEGFFYHNKRGVELYNQADPKKAAALLKEGGYDGTTLRILTSMQYEFHFKMAQVAAENLRDAGFKVDMIVVDWATLTQQRNDPKQWELFFTHAPFQPDPYLINFFNDEYPGWWVNAKKTELAARFNAEFDLDKRALILADIQELMYEEAAVIKVGSFNMLNAVAKNVKGFIPSSWPFFWNAAIE